MRTDAGLARLYTDVISTITSYGGLLWTDVVAQIDAMNERVFSFQNSSKKLPKGLREWPAYLECKRTIDEFLEVLPLFQQLAHRALRPRWGFLPPRWSQFDFLSRESSAVQEP